MCAASAGGVKTMELMAAKGVQRLGTLAPAADFMFQRELKAVTSYELITKDGYEKPLQQTLRSRKCHMHLEPSPLPLVCHFYGK